ncbi:hypothetical protein QF048_000929 [Streptomyces sp. W4I9-2]|nr:hypothetical protein [Streptomyces sp. W4I9-2]
MDRIRVGRRDGGRPRARPDHLGAQELPGLATRYDKRAYVFHGTVTLAAIRLWLCS